MRILAIITVLLTLVACEPKPKACIDMPEIFPAGQAVKFVSCSDDYDFLLWEFGTGEGIESESPTYRYDEEGARVIRLSAYSDGAFRSDEAEETHYVSYKYLDRFELTGNLNGFGTELTFQVGDETFEATLVPGNYPEDAPYVFEVFEQRVQLRPGEIQYAVRAGSIQILNGDADFSRFDQAYSEVSSPTSSRTLRVYWRYRPISEFN